MKLFPSQTKELFDLIKREGLLPEEFELQDNILGQSEYGRQYTFIFKNDDSIRFFIYVYEKIYSIEQFPGKGKFKSEYEIKDFYGIREIFSSWLKMVTEEKNTIDYFEYYKNHKDEIPQILFDSNDKFTSDELLQLDAKLNLLKEKILALNLLPIQKERLNSKIEELKPYAKSMNKINWWELFMGALIGCIMSLGINLENAKLLWDVIRDLFSIYLLKANIS